MELFGPFNYRVVSVSYTHLSYSALFHRLFVAPALICRNQLSELRSVIAQMIDSHRLIAEKIENTVQRAAQHGLSLIHISTLRGYGTAVPPGADRTEYGAG